MNVPLYFWGLQSPALCHSLNIHITLEIAASVKFPQLNSPIKLSHLNITGHCHVQTIISLPGDIFLHMLFIHNTVLPFKIVKPFCKLIFAYNRSLILLNEIPIKVLFLTMNCLLSEVLFTFDWSFFFTKMEKDIWCTAKSLKSHFHQSAFRIITVRNS